MQCDAVRCSAMQQGQRKEQHTCPRVDNGVHACGVVIRLRAPEDVGQWIAPAAASTGNLAGWANTAIGPPMGAITNCTHFLNSSLLGGNRSNATDKIPAMQRT